MIASFVLGFMLLGILGFYSLVRLQMASCEGGVYHAPLTSAEEWSASLDVALGLDMFSCTEDEQVDAMWDMVPMVCAWEGAARVDYTHPTPVVYTHVDMLTAYHTLRIMCYV